MAGYDPDELNEQAENAEVPEGKGVITDIQETVANEVYGDVDFDYDRTKPMIGVTVDPNLDDDEIEEVTEAFSFPDSDASWYNPNFKLGQFRERYGSVPEEGMEVELSVDDETGMVQIDY